MKLAFKNPIFQPSMYVVTAITNAFPLQVTTSTDGVNPAPHHYQNGLIVRIDIPRGFGMQQINQQFAPITVNSPTTFLMPIDSTNFDTFSTPSQPYLAEQYVMSVPIGEISANLNSAVQNVAPV